MHITSRYKVSAIGTGQMILNLESKECHLIILQPKIMWPLWGAKNMQLHRFC